MQIVRGRKMLESRIGSLFDDDDDDDDGDDDIEIRNSATNNRMRYSTRK